MLIVITGGMGAGKSSIINAMKELPDFAAKFISVDEIVAEYYNLVYMWERSPDSFTTEPLATTIKTLANVLYELFQTYDRKKIAAVVFKDETPETLEKRRKLEDAFREPIIERIEFLKRTNDTVILEFPTFFDKQIVKQIGKRTVGEDVVISVIADEHLRIERATQRGDDPALIKKKINAQVKDTVRMKGSDLCLSSNTTSPEDNALRVMHFIRKRKDPSYKHAVTAGSFDPLTIGHVWMIEKSLKVCDHLTILVANNPTKKHMFSIKQRRQMIEDTLNEFSERLGPELLSKISIMELDHRLTTVGMAQLLNAELIIRGIRNQTDFTYENDLALVNRSIDERVETVYLIPPREYTEVSSSLVRNLMGLYGWEKLVNRYVSNSVLYVLKEKQQSILMAAA